MRMTDAQATAYCKSQGLASLTGRPSGEETSREWNRLRDEIEQNGLDAVEARLTTWLEQVQADQDPRHSAHMGIADELLNVIYDSQEIKRAIAGELKEKVKEEIDKQSTYPLRALYLQHLRNFLGSVQDDAADLEDYEQTREELEEQLEQLETEYGKWITDAIAAQED